VVTGHWNSFGVCVRERERERERARARAGACLLAHFSDTVEEVVASHTWDMLWRSVYQHLTSIVTVICWKLLVLM